MTTTTTKAGKQAEAEKRGKAKKPPKGELIIKQSQRWLAFSADDFSLQELKRVHKWLTAYLDYWRMLP